MLNRGSQIHVVWTIDWPTHRPLLQASRALLAETVGKVLKATLASVYSCTGNWLAFKDMRMFKGTQTAVCAEEQFW